MTMNWVFDMPQRLSIQDDKLHVLACSLSEKKVWELAGIENKLDSDFVTFFCWPLPKKITSLYINVIAFEVHVKGMAESFRHRSYY